MRHRSPRRRPDTVPREAEWSEEDNEWVLGTRDADREYHGEVHYWTPDGTLVSIANQHHGQWHGECRRYHPNGEPSQIDHYDLGVLHGLRTWIACEEPTTEVMHVPGMSEDIWRTEVLYERGRPLSFRYFVRDGTEVERDGSPVVQRPPGVPERAVFEPKSSRWFAGTWDADGKRDGEQRVFRADGSLLAIEHYADNVANGAHEVFRPDGTPSMRRTMVDGEMAGRVEFIRPDGSLARAGNVIDGRWEELIDYDPAGEMVAMSTTDEPVPTPDVPPLTNRDEAILADDSLPVGELSAQARSHLVAVGWGGDASRDAAAARVARSRARSDDRLMERLLRSLGLDTAPRLITATRLNRLLELSEGVDDVDATALRQLLVQQGGVARTAALSGGGSDAIAFVRDRVNKGRLDLQRMALTELPSALRHVVDLSNLELANNELTELPAWIADLAFLHRLNLNDNRLTDLPDALARMTELRNLHVSNNAFTAVPNAIIEHEHLTVLNLSGNEISDLPDAFGDLELREIWLNNMPLCGLPSTFGRLPLTFLHLGDAPWSTPPSCLWELESLRTLWLSSKALQHLPPEVSQLESLRTLVVWYSSLTELPDELFQMTHLEELRIGHNPLPEGTIDALKEALPNCKVY